jgi:RND family efflux transporter MFP subunit
MRDAVRLSATSIYSGMVLTISGAAILPLLSCGHPEPANRPVQTVSTARVKLQKIEQHTRYSGDVRPETLVTLAFKTAGYVVGIARTADGPRSRDIQQGDEVHSGQMLVRVQQGDYRANLDASEARLRQANAAVQAAQAQLGEAQAGLKYATLTRERAERLFNAGSLTKPDYDGAEAQYRAALAKVDAAKEQVLAQQTLVTQAQAKIEAAKTAFSDTELRAPFSGIVLLKSVERGALVGPGSPGITIADVRTVKIAFGAPESALPNFKLGQRIEVTFDAIPGREFTGVVSSISPAADPRERVFTIEVRLPNSNGLFRVGMIASVLTPSTTSQPEYPVVPLSAIVPAQPGSQNYALFVASLENSQVVARLRRVRTGQMVGDSIVVLEGLTGGETVVTSGAKYLTDGQIVNAVH